MTNDELQKVLDQHQHWINKDCDGWKELRADLHEADLCEADLRGADLLSSSKLHTISLKRDCRVPTRPRRI